MICQICGANQATVHLTEIIEGQMTELHICEQCAKDKSISMEQQFGLSDLLAGLVDFGKQAEDKDLAKIVCPNCKLSYQDFKKIGRLGCSNCYSAFAKYLLSLLKRIHGSSLHTGKVPATSARTQAVVAVEKPVVKEKIIVSTPETELLELKKKLQDAVVAEKFEEAAQLRDAIKNLEKNIEDAGTENSGEQSEKRKKKST